MKLKNILYEFFYEPNSITTMRPRLRRTLILKQAASH